MSFQEIAYLSLFPVTASIILHEEGGKAWYSTGFRRRFKDEAGTWKTIGTFVPKDLPVVVKIAADRHHERSHK